MAEITPEMQEQLEEKHQRFRELGVKAFITYVNFEITSRVDQTIENIQFMIPPEEKIDEKMVNSARSSAFKSVLQPAPASQEPIPHS